MKKLVIVFTLVLFIPSLLLAQDPSGEDYSKYAGYVDLNKFEGFKKSDRSVEVYLKKPLLSLVAAFTADEDPELQKLISNLALIRVEQFEVDREKSEEVIKLIDKVSKKMIDNKWDKLVRARDHNEHVEVFMKSDGAKISGLLVMALEKSGEASFINIVGELDLNLLGKLGAKFNIPSLGHVNSSDDHDHDHETSEDEEEED